MSFLSPLLLLLALLAIPIIVMYMLRLRRQEVVVSSTFLWQKLVRDREANAPWQKLRRNLLLILQLIILGLLVVALARPFLRIPSVVNRSVVVLLDGSPSMTATDTAEGGFPTRFDAAKAEVNRLIRSLSGGNQMTIIRVGPVPEVLVAASGDKRQLFDVVEAAVPDSAPVDWPAAFALAAGAAQGYRDARVIIVSDGGLPTDLPPLPSDTAFVPIGVSHENLGISALATRSSEDGVELFAGITNYGQVNQSTLFSLGINGQLFDARELFIPAGETVNVTWELADSTAVVVAQISSTEFDHLAIDDQAITVHEGGTASRTLVVTEGNLFVEQIFSVLPRIEPFKAGAGRRFWGRMILISTSLTGFRYRTRCRRPTCLSSIPRPDGRPEPLINVTGVMSGTQQTAAIRLIDNQLLQFVDWSEVSILQAQQVEASWARPLVEAEGGTSRYDRRTRAGHRIAVLTFDLQQSDLPLQITFPILMANLTEWLNPGQAFKAPAGLRPGDVVTLVPNATSSGIAVTRPDGTVWQGRFDEGELLYTETTQPGLYLVDIEDDSGTQPAGAFAINLFADEESTIGPVETLSIGAADIAAGTGDDVGRYEFWIWLAIVALIVLLIEWWVYHRGTRWPTLRDICGILI